MMLHALPCAALRKMFLIDSIDGGAANNSVASCVWISFATNKDLCVSSAFLTSTHHTANT